MKMWSALLSIGTAAIFGIEILVLLFGATVPSAIVFGALVVTTVVLIKIGLEDYTSWKKDDELQDKVNPRESMKISKTAKIRMRSLPKRMRHSRNR